MRNRLSAALLTAATVLTVVLLWFGVRNLEQENAAQRQQARERLESGADAIAAGVRGKLAEAGERLSGWISNPNSPLRGQEGAVIVAAGEGRTLVVPPGALPFLSGAVLKPQQLDAVFADAETAELGGNQSARAAEMYRALARHRDPRIRAEALLRLGRVLRKERKFDAALETYRSLASLDDSTVSGLPAGLAGLDGQRLTMAAAGDRAAEERIGAQIARLIDRGHWQLARGAAWFYRGASSSEPKPESWILAEALTRLWEEEGGADSSGASLKVVDVEGRRVMVIWRSNGLRSAALAGLAETFVAGSVGTGYAYQLTDAAGQRIAGAAVLPSQTVARMMGDPQNPWMIRLWSESGVNGTKRLGPRLVLAMLAVVILFLWGTVYFMARAIRRETRVARLQSDFVAAVSHEFRSPLTTVRQLAEMLEMDQVPSEDRRRKYYRVLAAEARRLQRLVETLLNFAIYVWGGPARRFMTAPTAGGPPRELYRIPDGIPANVAAFSSLTAWTADGGHLLALRRVSGAGEVWSFATKGGPPEKSTIRQRPSEAPAVSPDGTRIAFVAGNNKAEVWAMTGVLGEAKSVAARKQSVAVTKGPR